MTTVSSECYTNDMTDEEQIEYIYNLIDTSFDDNHVYINFFRHKFQSRMVKYINELSLFHLDQDLVEYTLSLYMEMNNTIPYVFKHDFTSYQHSLDISNILSELETKNTHEQQSSEWYETRKNKFTASSMWKIFKSESSRNSIIYEKCASKPKQQYYGGPMEWGNKYENVTIMLYEHLYSTTVGNFGCITHKDYPFIGASPDGIVTDSTSPLYGRMLEIKNIVNREITQIPKEEYWIQMQIQMEVCELESCDFVETRFKEYTEEEFYSDFKHDYRGVILYFSKKNKEDDDEDAYKPHYEYYPLSSDYSQEEINAWIVEKEELHRETYILYNKYYYYLEEYSCVVVQRNRKWFNSCISEIIDTWNTVLKERETGYDHRASKQRSNSITHEEQPVVVVTKEEGNESRMIHNLTQVSQVITIKLD